MYFDLKPILDALAESSPERKRPRHSRILQPLANGISGDEREPLPLPNRK